MVRRTCTPHPNLFIFPKRLANGAYDNNNIHGSHTLQLVRTLNQQKISKIVESQIPIYRPPFLSFPIFSFTFHKCYSRGLFPPLYRLFPILSFPFLSLIWQLTSDLLCPFFLLSSVCLDREKNDWKAETSASCSAQTLSPSNPHCLYVRDCFLGLITIAQSTDTCHHHHTFSKSLISTI